MKIAISGSHGTGKSTLLAALLARRPHYREEPEAFELFGDEITLLPGEGPDIDGLALLLEHTIETLVRSEPGDSIVFERSPVDYLAYAAASEAIPAAERAVFVEHYVPAVREAIRHLDLLVLLSTKGVVAARPDDDEGFRDRVDAELRRALIDDEHDLFDGPDSPRIVELSPDPDRWLGELARETA